MFAQQEGRSNDAECNPSPVKVNGKDVPATSQIHPTLLALSGMAAEQATTSKIASTRPLSSTRYGQGMEVIPVQHQDQALYQSCIISTFLYGSEYSKITQSDLSKLFTSIPRT